MSRCTERNIEFLKSLISSKPKIRNQLISKASSDEIHCLTEIAHNVLKGNIHFDKKTLVELKRFKTPIRKIADKDLSCKKRKRILQQKGGFLSLLITPIVTALIEKLLSAI